MIKLKTACRSNQHLFTPKIHMKPDKISLNLDRTKIPAHFSPNEKKMLFIFFVNYFWKIKYTCRSQLIQLFHSQITLQIHGVEKNCTISSIFSVENWPICLLLSPDRRRIDCRQMSKVIHAYPCVFAYIHNTQYIYSILIPHPCTHISDDNCNHRNQCKNTLLALYGDVEIFQ